jgi:hypothetical protein
MTMPLGDDLGQGGLATARQAPHNEKTPAAELISGRQQIRTH